VLLLGVLAPWRGQVRTAAARRWLRRAAAVVGLVMAAWVTQRVLWYVPAKQATYAQIQLGMTAREVDALFGRPPFLDSDTAPTGADLRAALQRDTRERGWDGPEGQIIVTFDREGRVDRALFTPASHPPTPLDWLRARLGLWP
jgi:hypothetical protein